MAPTAPTVPTAPGATAPGASGAAMAPGAPPPPGQPLPSRADERATARRQLVLLGLGVAAVVLGSVAGGGEALGRVLEPPFPVGLLLGAAAGVVGVVVVLRAAARVGRAHDDARELIRAIRLIFLAVGLFAAAAGWFIGSAMPIVAGLIIVGIDVIETTFLLLVTAGRGSEGSGGSEERARPAADAGPQVRGERPGSGDPPGSGEPPLSSGPPAGGAATGSGASPMTLG